MSGKTLEKFIREYMESQDTATIHFIWQGGEPTLAGLDFYQKVINLQTRYSNGKRIENAFQTNGILLNDAWCAFFAEHHFLIGISIDGPEHLHNHFRSYKSGKSSFDSVLRGIAYLKKHQVEFNTLTVVNRINADFPREVYQFLRDTGSGFMQFIPAVEAIHAPELFNSEPGTELTGISGEVTDWSVEPAQFGKFLCGVFDEWLKSDVGKYYVQAFDVALEGWYGLSPGLCIFAETCGMAPVIEHNGDVFACDHYVYPRHKLGNIKQQSLPSLVFSDKQLQFAMDKKIRLPDTCGDCKFLFACRGGCPKHRITQLSGHDKRLNYLCEGYQLFFAHIAPYMEFMANELRHHLPPANVMQWAKNRASDSGGLLPDSRVV